MALLAFFVSPTQWIIVGIVAFLLFGHRLPKLARSLGQSITEFRRGFRDVLDDPEEPAPIIPRQPQE